MVKVTKEKSNVSSRYKIVDILALIVLILCASYVFSQTYNNFILLPEQKKFLGNLEYEFQQNNNYAKIEKLYPKDNWDTVCIVPAHAYNIFSKQDKVQKYYGDHYWYHWLTAPHPTSMFFGVGFSFLNEGKLQNFIKIPTAQIRLFLNGKWFSFEPVLIKTSFEEYKRRNEKGLTFSDLNVSFQNKEQKCYGRKTAFIKIVDYQNIQIGE